MQTTVFFIFSFFSCTCAQLITNGQCPRARVVENFDINAYSGKWFDIMTYPHLFRTEVCKEHDIKPTTKVGTNPVIYKEIINGRVRGVRGLVRVPNPVLGRLKITLRVPIAGDSDTDYDILGTDYENWALVYSCQEILGMRVEQAWMLSRHRELSFEGRQQIDNLLKVNNIDPEPFRPAPQTECPDLDTVPFTFVA